MPTVYRVLTDPDVYRSIRCDDMKSIMQIQFDGSPIGDGWSPPPSYVPFPRKKAGDFYGCYSNDSLFAVTKDAAALLATFWDQSCEMLPIPSDNDALLLCNVTLVVNCLDEKQSSHKPGIPHWIDTYVFHSQRFEHSLFKIPQTCMSEILCVEGLPGGDDGFKKSVDNLGLSGLRFEEIWTDNDGGR